MSIEITYQDFTKEMINTTHFKCHEEGLLIIECTPSPTRAVVLYKNVRSFIVIHDVKHS